MTAPKQLTFTTIGGEVVTAAQRGKHYIQPRGYYFHPGTGPAGETCGSCKHKTGRRHLKCVLNCALWTHSRRTDILAGSPACKYWESKKP